jgi:lipopolysaccharide/colanic/teichoic acid biosynthesis glycosyltransferase
VNILAAAVGLVVSIPLMLLIALAVAASSRGPVLHRQKRVGQGGQIFTMYKFRSMSDRRRGPRSPEVWARRNDPRITYVGSILRKHRLDELPQLFNVLRGEMNVVGPRPEQPAISLHLTAHIEPYAGRQAVLPGITGWAQINHPYDRSLDDVRRKVELDLEYIRRRSPAEDLKIMARTLPVMIGGKGSH